MHLRRWVFLLPALLSFYWLRELGAFDWSIHWVVPGSDYYAGAAVTRLMQVYGGAIPAHIHEFNYPLGIEKVSIAEYLFETLWQVWIWLGALIHADPFRIMWTGALLSTLANIWGVWMLLWTRWGKESPAGVAIGWSVILLNSWAWMRTPDHWFLSWMPIYLWAILLWWDFFSGRARVAPWKMALSHGLLLAQSVYYGIFQSFLILVWSLFALKKMRRSREFRRQWLTLGFAMALGFGVSSTIFLARVGGLDGLRAARASTTRELNHAYWYSFRVREILRGGEGSGWNLFAQKVAKQKPEVFAKEGEGYPCPWPKLLFVFGVAGAVLVRRRSKAELHEWTKSEVAGVAFAAGGIFFLLFLGLQETFFFRRYLIYPWLPQIRSYARLMLPIYFLSGILAILMWKRFDRAALALTFAIILIAIDYGPPASAKSWRERPVCEDGVQAIGANPGPILFQSVLDAEWKKDLPEHEDGCLKMAQDSFAFHGFPYLHRFREPLSGELREGTPQCAEWREKLVRARAAYGSGRVLWWFEGSDASWAASRACLVAQDQFNEIFQLPLSGGHAQIRLVEVRSIAER